MVLLTLILKTTISPKKSTLKWLKVDDNKVNRFGISSSKKIAKKLEKSKSQNWSKLGNLKNKKSSKFQKLAKSEKKLFKSVNLPYFNTIEARQKFLTLDAKIIFNCL